MENFDLSPYNSSGVRYLIPSDGYLFVDTKSSSNVSITINIYAKDQNSYTYSALLQNSGVHLIYVKCGSYVCYTSGSPLVFRYVKFVY